MKFLKNFGYLFFWWTFVEFWDSEEECNMEASATNILVFCTWTGYGICYLGISYLNGTLLTWHTLWLYVPHFIGFGVGCYMATNHAIAVEGNPMNES